MTITQTNRSNMIESVQSYLALHADTIADPAGLTTSIQKLTELMEAIWVKDNEKNVATNGKTAKKKDSGSALERAGIENSSRVIPVGKARE